MTIAYGLERFWGEHLRLKGKKASDENKSRFWKETWDAFCTIMEDTKTGINLPKDLVRSDDMNKIRAISKQLWELPVEKQRVKLLDKMKKVDTEKGAFFNTEALPEGSILVFPIALKEKGWKPFGEEPESELYFGGLESIGFGRCRIVLQGEYQ